MKFLNRNINQLIILNFDLREYIIYIKDVHGIAIFNHQQHINMWLASEREGRRLK